MKVDKDKLKKHHFWILLGIVPLLVLIAVLMISSGVGAAIAAKQKDIKSAEDELKAKSNPKPDALIARLDKQVEKLGQRRGTLWEENWNMQKGMFTWPNSPMLKQIEAMGLKFGEKLPKDDGQFEEFKKREVYVAEFANPSNPNRPGIADLLAPTEFAGGWGSVLRYVNDWGQFEPTAAQLWLVMEDIWVQRALINAIRTVNTEMAKFVRVPLDEKAPAVDDKLHRKFRSRIWDVELKVGPRESDKKPTITGTLTNTTDRLQLLGVGNQMTLKVWLETGPNAQPFEFRISSEFVPGKGTLKIVPAEDHVIPPGTNIAEIAKVEQVYDTRSVPVRRIDRLVMGYLDSRNAMAELKAHKLIPVVATSSAGFGGGGLPGEGGPGGTPGGVPGGVPGGPGGAPAAGEGGSGGEGGPGGGVGMGGLVNGVFAGGGSLAAVGDGSRRRYFETNDQVRRMPVGIVLIVDQMFLQDVLLAYANCPLRFQITQVHWQRFRGNLGGSGGFGGSAGGGLPGGGLPGEGGVSFSGPARFGGSFSGGAPRGEDASSGGGGPGGFAPPSGIPGVPGSFGPPGGSGMFSGGGSLTTVSDAQLTAGLIEVSIYGMISLYEKYTPPAETPTDPMAPTEPKGDPMPMKEGDPTPMPGKNN